MSLSSQDYDNLLRTTLRLAGTRDRRAVVEITRDAARELTGADGVAFVVNEGDNVHYLEENAIAPLWKGRRLPSEACISGWAMAHRKCAVVEDVQSDPRIPPASYASTFVKSLAMVPIGTDPPVAALGAYWAEPRRATDREVEILRRLAEAVSTALANASTQELARDSLAARDDMIASAAHELRNAFHTIVLRLATLRPAVQKQADAPAQQSFSRLTSMVNDATKLLESLLDASRLSSGTLQLEYEPVELVALTQTVMQRLDDEIQASGSAVDLQSSGPVDGNWDRMRMEQIATNLLCNAIKYGLGKPIEAGVRGDQATATLVVKDHGMGISEEDQASVFAPFVRSKDARKLRGVGLGLWIVRQLVEAHGGTIRVESAPGQGSKFVVVLPRHLIESHQTAVPEELRVESLG